MNIRSADSPTVNNVLSRRLWVLPILLMIAACGGDEDDDAPAESRDAVAVVRGFPPGSSPAPPGDAVGGAAVAPADSPTLWVVTFGSSGNPATVRGVVVHGQRIELTIADDPGKPATMDYGPTTSTVVLDQPPAWDQPITVVLGDRGTVEIDPRTPGEFAWVA